MPTPPLLLGATLLFWSWQTGSWIIGPVLALGAESSRLIRRRYEFSVADFNRASDLGAVILLAIMVWRYMAGTYSIMLWLPLALFPLLIIQTYSTTSRTPLGAIFWTFRQKAKKKPLEAQDTFDLSYLYVIVTLLSAAEGNSRQVWFYVGLLILSGWALWPWRSLGQRPRAWIIILTLAAGLGYVGQHYLHLLQLYVEGRAETWFSGASSSDPYRSQTAIGDIRTIKLGDRVLFRVQSDKTLNEPLLLREAVYNVYLNPRWLAANTVFKEIEPSAEGSTWIWDQPSGPERLLTVSCPLVKGQGLLKVPLGTYRIDRLLVEKLLKNSSGVLKVLGGPGLLSYQVRWQAGPHVLGDAPGPADILIPEREKPLLISIGRELGLSEKSGSEVLTAVQNYFLNGFTYSLTLTRADLTTSPINDFLSRTKSGHCEYFATAAALILRAAGYPTRYVTGYLVEEFSSREGRYLVRARHAHAWILVYVNGSWRELDPTPPVWLDLEKGQATRWEVLTDLWSWAGFKISEWRWGDRSGTWPYMVGLLIVAVIIVSRGLFFKKRIAVTRSAETLHDPLVSAPGLDSPFYQIAEKLAVKGFRRRPAEPWPNWLLRIEQAGVVPPGELRQMMKRHCQLRFDPQGATPEDLADLTAAVENWLKAGLAASEPGPGPIS